MANPKYANLPGIAYDQPDVYETSDLPESEQVSDSYEEEPENESIERLHISAKDAFSKFKGKSLTGYVDFSDRLSRRIRTGYDARSGDFELAAEGEQETPMQKYQRIRCEISELLEEVSVVEDTSTEEQRAVNEEMTKQLETTRRLMEGLQLEEKLGVDCLITGDSKNADMKKLKAQLDEFKKAATEKNSDDDATQSKSSSNVFQNTRAADLEMRLHKIESVLGYTPEKMARINATIGCSNLIGAAQILSSRAALLVPSQLDHVEVRLGNIAAKMDGIVQQSGGGQVSERDQKIIALYDVAKSIEPMAQLVPHLLQRMKALEVLHHEASNFSKWLAELESLQNTITSGVQNNKNLLQGVQEVFAQNLQNVNEEIAKIDSRIKALGKK